MARQSDPEVSDSASGERLLTSKQAAEFLGYHYGSIRRLVIQGELRPHTRAGKTMLFRRSELERYNIKSGRAPHIANVRRNPPPGGYPRQMSAVARIGSSSKGKVFRKMTRFTWDDLETILSRVTSKKGWVPFHITINLPYGDVLEMACRCIKRKTPKGVKIITIPFFTN